MQTENKTSNDLNWIIDNKTIYCLHETGRYKKGEPELCNKFYFNIQPDYGRGVTDEEAAVVAKQVHEAITKYKLLEDSHNKLLVLCNRLKGLCSQAEKEIIENANKLTQP